MDSSQSSFRFVRVDEFTPNSSSGWASFGPVTACNPDATGLIFTLTGTSPGQGSPAPVLKITILGPSAFRLRFNPAGDYTQDGSFAVVQPNLGAVTPQVVQNDATKLSVDLGGIRLDVLFSQLMMQVYRGGQLINADAGQGIVYIPRTTGPLGGKAVANFKVTPSGANYFGFGEKGGRKLRMNGTNLTFFNYDNFKYAGGAFDPQNDPFGVIPQGECSGPLNESEPLYNSIPFLIEDNPSPAGGAPYAYGIFLDNESQSYFNLGATSDMQGQYYFGALYGELDYYFMAGDDAASVIDQYTTLTGRPALAPMWALGYHQGCYGYYNHDKVMAAVMNYRAANIPLDGIHIDVDFQDNYRTFTASPEKFPGGGAPTFAALAAVGVKASVNVTGIVTLQPLDEAGNATSYSVLESGLAIGAFIPDVRAEASMMPAARPFVTNEDYGCNYGTNPYLAPGPASHSGCGGATALGTYGYYADLGRPNIRTWWGQQYEPLLDAGLEMVWQDMTDPATSTSISDSMPWKTLALNLMMFDPTSDGLVPHAWIHNVFALNLISATYEGLVALRSASGVDKRPFIIARGGYAGVQRYAATWTGDSASSWQFLSILIPEILNFGLSGQPLSGADVGGFAAESDAPPVVQGGSAVGNITDPELLTRWTTMSAFFGWFRNHYDGYDKEYQEPFNYSEPVPSNCRKYIEIRYRLLQLFYDSLYEATQTGMPICRPLFLTDRSDPNVYQHLDDQFMVGADLLVAPVVTQGRTSRDVYLPATSSWYAYQDNVAPLVGPSPGGQTISWYVPLNIVPLYVRAGAIIPHRELEQYVGQLPQNPLTFDIYPGPDSVHELYLDDGIASQATTANRYRLTDLSQSQQIARFRVQTLRVRRTHDTFTPKEPFYYVAMLATPAPVSVAVDGRALPVIQAATPEASAAQLAGSTVNAAYYNPNLQTTFAKVFDVSADTQIVGTFPVS